MSKVKPTEPNIEFTFHGGPFDGWIESFPVDTLGAQVPGASAATCTTTSDAQTRSSYTTPAAKIRLTS